MLRPDVRISLADLSAAGVRLRPVDAVAIVRELVLQVARGKAPGVPSAHVIRFAPAGDLLVEGPVAAGGREVSRAAQLLEALLPSMDAGPDLRVPGGLRLVLARALGVLDLPPYTSLESFAEALERFTAADSVTVIRDLVTHWAAASAAAGIQEFASEQAPEASSAHSEQLDIPPASALVRDDAESEPVEQLSVSDVRRARRATGLSLSEISRRSRIPVSLLRQLEWGYLRHWPAGLYGRTQLVRYARAAGLDEEVVVGTVWPMLEAAGSNARDAADQTPVIVDDVVEAEAVTALDRLAGDPGDITIVDGHLSDDRPMVPSLFERFEIASQAKRRRRRILAALAIPALVALGLLPAAWDRLRDSDLSGRIGIESRDVSKAPPAAGKPAAPASTVARSAPDPIAPASGDSAGTSGVASAGKAVAAGEKGGARPAEGLTEAAVAYSPSFASVGSAMFYHEQTGGGSALVRADTNSDGAVLRITRVVDDNARNYHARPSPDGTRIAFDSDREGARAVYVADAEGHNVRRVSGEGFAAVPSWSPDGRTLAFVRAEADRPRVWNLWTADLETGDLRRLTSHRYGQPWGGSWFPDGRRMAYSHEDRLVVLDLETGRSRVYESPRKGRLVRTPAVAPDGRRIMFQVYRDGAWLLDLADESMRKVLADPSAEEYTWSPDGRRVAYHSRRSGQWGVWLMAPGQ